MDSSHEKGTRCLNSKQDLKYCRPPKGKKAIGSKSRLVAKRYSEQYGIDYKEKFSPVVKISTIRCILAIAATVK